MPRKATNVIDDNELVISKHIRLATAAHGAGDKGQREWKIANVPGLSLVVKPSGRAIYFVRFMAGQGARRKQVRQSIGDANGPKAIKLSAAKRRAVDIARDGAAAYGDDGEKTLTLRELFKQFYEGDRKRAPRTMNDYREALERDIFDSLGDVPVAEITAKDIAKALTKIEKRSPNAAHKCRAALGSLYKWATKRLLVDSNIMLGMGFTHKNAARDRILNDDELAAFWRAIESEEFGATPAMRIILKLAILTGQRNSEVAGARTSELHIDDSVANPYWHIPGARMKRKDRDQYVFLSRQARQLFATAVAIASGSKYVFPATTYGRQVEGVEREHISQESVSRAAARAAELAGLEDVHLHDLRKSIATWLGERGERSDVLDRILHHHSGHTAGHRSSVTETHYNFSIMAGPLRDAWQRWADHVEQITSKGAAGNVVPLTRAG